MNPISWMELPNSTQIKITISVQTKHISKMMLHAQTHKRPGKQRDSNRGTCAEQLCGIFYILFMESLELQKKPVIWKHSAIVPVAKCKKP